MKISILTPSYNSADFIERAIQSVLEQNYQDFEHIIIDGGSKDGTLDILKKYPHLKWISEPDKGQSDAMNKAFRMSTGEIIAYMNADDYFLPGVFNKTIIHFEQGIDMVIGNLEMYNVPAKSTSIYKPSIQFEEIIKFYDYKFPLNPVSYFYRSSIQEQIGDFPVSNHLSMDFWFLIRAYKIATIKKIEETMGVFWVTGENKSADFFKGYKDLLHTALTFVDNKEQLTETSIASTEYLFKIIQKHESHIKEQHQQLSKIYESKMWRIATYLKKLTGK